MKTILVIASLLVAAGLSAQSTSVNSDIVLPKEVKKVQTYTTTSCPVGYEGHYLHGDWEEQDDCCPTTTTSMAGIAYFTSGGATTAAPDYRVCVSKKLMDELRKTK